MMMHCDAKDFKPCRVFCDGKDISEVAFCWDVEAGVAYCYVPLNQLFKEMKSAYPAMAEDIWGNRTIEIPGDNFLVRRVYGKIEVRDL
jgi:hypothetical protein